MYILKLLTGQLQTFLSIIMNTDHPNGIVVESLPFTRQKILFLFGNIGPKAISFFVFSCKKGFQEYARTGEVRLSALCGPSLLLRSEERSKVGARESQILEGGGGEAGVDFDIKVMER